MKTLIFLLALVVPVQTFATGAPDDGAQMYSVSSERANIRSGPGMEHPVAWIAEKECSLKVLDMRGEWYQVSDGEETLGWIHKDVTWGFSGNSELEESSGEL